MSHLVLARKYRPKYFHEVVGQDDIISTLKAALLKKRIAPAMLFTGGRGIGKTTIARLLAKALVCTKPLEIEPCNTCAQCIAIDNFSSLDVNEIDGASHTGVDDIRGLRDSARYQPTSAQYKIFIIDEVHMLSISAFNALLKILEEPPPHVIFIFATTEAHKIPKTVLSRCQRYDFKRVSIDTIFHALKKIMALEGHDVPDAGLYLIASLADGSLRDALSITEQILNTPLEHYSADFISQTLGVVSHSAVKDICHAIIDANVDRALLIVKETYEKGFDLCQLMDAIAEHFRILSLCAHIDEKSAQTIIPSLDKNDFIFSKERDKTDLKRLFAMALDNMPQVFQAQKPLLALELFILRAALRPPISDAVTINYCLQKLDAIMHNRQIPRESELSKPIQEKNPLVPSTKSMPLPIKPSKIIAEFDEQKALYDQAINNPLVKKALEIFGGDITEVKKIPINLRS